MFSNPSKAPKVLKIPPTIQYLRKCIGQDGDGGGWMLVWKVRVKAAVELAEVELFEYIFFGELGKEEA